MTNSIDTRTPFDPTGAAAPSASPDATTRSDQRLDRAAGVAALVKAATYAIGFGVMGAYLAPRGFTDAQGDPHAMLEVLTANAGVMYAWYLVLYLVGGLALLVLVQGLRARLAPVSPAMATTAAAVGTVWAGLLLASGLIALVGQTAVLDLTAGDPSLATSTWSAVSVVQDALGGGIELVGGVWALLVGWLGLRGRVFGVSFSLNAVLIGILGVASVVPSISDVMAASFGVTFLVWFAWAGVVLLRPRRTYA